MALSRVWSRTFVRIAVACCIILVLMSGAALAAASLVNVQQQVTINRAVLNTIVATTTTPAGTTTCQDPFACMFPGEADQKWGSGNYLASGTTPCGYSSALATAVVAKYCYAQTIACKDPCQCLSPVEARQKWGADMSQCSASPCGKTIPLTDTLPAIKYCYQQKSAAVNVIQPVVSRITVQLPSCPAGKTLCIGTAVSCVDTSRDSKNCGSCGKTCGFSQECVNGNCQVKVVQAQTVDPCMIQGKRTCSGACADTGSDVFNCGDCGNICDQGFKCISGQCSLGCAQGYDECRYDCVNLKTDPENCGDCGNTCDTGRNQVCSNGLCACKGDMLICDPKVGCSDVDSNPKQCGSCNNVCSPSQTCVQGHCTNLCDLGPSHFSKFSWADWQGMNWLTAVRDQHGCGSCWAMATLGVTEGMYNIEQGRQMNLDLSEQNLMSCSGAGNCEGGWPFNAAKYVASPGVVTETCEPYTHSDAGCYYSCSNPDQNRWKITQHTDLSLAGSLPRDTYTWKQNLLCKGPLAACDYDHCITIVGWDDSIQSWIFKNSWTEGWGTNGYGTRAYNDDTWTKFAWWWGGVTQ